MWARGLKTHGRKPMGRGSDLNLLFCPNCVQISEFSVTPRTPRTNLQILDKVPQSLICCQEKVAALCFVFRKSGFVVNNCLSYMFLFQKIGFVVTSGSSKIIYRGK